MKLHSHLLTFILINICSSLYAQQVTYSGKNVPLKTVFAAIQKQTGYGFFYEQTVLSSAKPVTIHVTNAAIKNVLATVFKNQPLEYSIENKTILVTKKKVFKSAFKQKSPIKVMPGKSPTASINQSNLEISNTVQEKRPDTILSSDKTLDKASSLDLQKSKKDVPTSEDTSANQLLLGSDNKVSDTSHGKTTAWGTMQPGQIISNNFTSQPDFRKSFFNGVFGAAQKNEKITFGVKGGFTISKRPGGVSGSGSKDFYLGIFADKKMTSKVNLGTEIAFALLGRTTHYELPVHFKYNLSASWNVLGGPRFDIPGFRYGDKLQVGLSAEVGSQYQINQIFFAEARFAHRLIAQDKNVLRLGIGANFTRNESIESKPDKPEPIRLRLGLNAGVASTGGYGSMLGFDLRIQENFSTFAAGTLTVGFSHYFRDPGYIEYLNYFPVKAGFKLFPLNILYIAPEAGFAFGLGLENDRRPFVYAAGTGVQLKNGFDIGLRYEKISGLIGPYYIGMPVIKNPGYFALRAEYGFNLGTIENKSSDFREPKDPPAWIGTHKKAVFIELMGHGIGVTGNFDMRLHPDQNDGLGFSAGAGFVDRSLNLPLVLNYIVGKRRSGLEAGIGVTGLFSKHENFFWGVNAGENFTAVGVVSLGYRLQTYKGLIVRANLTAVYDGLYYGKFFHEEGIFYPHLPGLAIGYTFK